MSYDLCVWEGPRPSDDEAALVEYERLMDRYDEDPQPPTPAIRAFVEALTARWPDDEEGMPWSVSEILEGASGPLVYLTMHFGSFDEVLQGASALARERGLVCFDPQMESLL